MKITKKSQAVKIAGGTARALAAILGISEPSLCVWPENLTRRQRHEITGALIDAGLMPESVGKVKRVGQRPDIRGKEKAA